MADRDVTFGIENILDKSNVIKSSSFHMDEGDILHIIYKDHFGATITIALVDSDGGVETVQVIPTTVELGIFIKYGALYNWYAVDTGMLASSGWAVPTRDQWIILVNYLGGYTIAGGKLKETGLTYWETNIAATNEVGFNGRGAGYRYDDGSFSDLKYMQVIWASSLYSPISAQQIQLMDGSGIVFCFETTTSSFTSGNSIRLVRDATEAEQLLDDGTACDNYVGNDGKVYPTVKIGTQVWLAANLAETKYNDDSDIPVVTDNATWAALTTGAMCYYNNDITNAYEETEHVTGLSSTGDSTVVKVDSTIITSDQTT